MSNLNPSTLIAGTQSLRSYELNGVHHHSEGIPSIYRFVYDKQLTQQSGVNFRVPYDVHLLSAWVLVDSSTAINSSSTARISSSDWAGIEQFTITIRVLPFYIGDVIALNLPLVVLKKDIWFTFTPDNFTVNRLVMFGKMVHLNDDVVGGTY